jgi:DNA polymerase-3 subunit epsilon
MGCSATEIDWRGHGFEGSRLGYPLIGAGLFHTAAGSCTQEYRAYLRRKALPYDLKNELKARKYRWNYGIDGRPRSWHIEIDEGSLDAETFIVEKLNCACSRSLH